MACGIPPRPEGFVSLPAALFTFPPDAGGGSTRICHIPCPFWPPLCVGFPHHLLRHDVLCRWLHIAGLCSQHRTWKLGRRLTNYVQPYWVGQMGKNLPFPFKNPAWRCSSRNLTTPGSIHNCESETGWPRWTKPKNFWPTRWTPTSTSALTPTIVSSEPWELSTSREALLGLAGVSRPKPWWPRIRPSCAHPELCVPHLFQPSVLNPSGQIWGNPG